MEFLKNLIEKLNAPSSLSVGVYVSSDSKLEVVIYDKDLGQVKAYEKTDLKYDNVLRQVNIQEFEASLLFLINKMDIPSNYPYYVSLPNILTSIKSFPSDLEDLELEVALNSEAEKSYIFKKAEPKIGWNLLSSDEQTLTSKYIYSALQKEQVESIQQVFSRNNLKLQTIDTSFTSLIRGLCVSGILNKNIEEFAKWAMVIFSYNNYIIAKFEGKELVNILETPLALKSIEPDILYQTVSSSLSEKMGVEGLDNLYLVSQTKDFVTETLSKHIKLICNVYTIDNNKFKDKPLFLSESDVSLEATSLESIGAAYWGKSEIDLNFNFSDADAKNEVSAIFAKIGINKMLHFYLFIGIIGSVILILISAITCSVVNGFLKDNIQKQTSQIDNLTKLNVPPPKVFNLDFIIKNTIKDNEDLLVSYDAIGATIPEKIWLESFFVDNELNTLIKGNAYTIDDIIIYFENLQKMAKFKDLKIKSIKIISGDGNTSENSNPIGKGLNLPLPPMPQQKNPITLNKNNYYQFIFYTTEATLTTTTNNNDNNKEQSLIDNVSGSVKKIFGN